MAGGRKGGGGEVELPSRGGEREGEPPPRQGLRGRV
jgi:hypothetical protein